MTDFLKAYPGVTRHEYQWEWTVPQVELAMLDSTRMVMPPDRKKRGKTGIKTGGRSYSTPVDFMKDLGIPKMKTD